MQNCCGGDGVVSCRPSAYVGCLAKDDHSTLPTPDLDDRPQGERQESNDVSQIVEFRQRGRVGLITIDNPPVNALSTAVRQGLVAAVETLAASGCEVGLIYCKGRTFCAGADITEFGKPIVKPDLREVVETIEDSSKPIIAALHGTALGGGFELTLGCHYRCATPSAKVGLPEVRLGLIPGAGGTQRGPRVLGIEAALDLSVSGEPIGATQARELGAIDEIIEGDLLEGALEYAERLAAENAAPRRIRDIALDSRTLPEAFFEDYRKKIAAKTRGFFAPERAVQAVEAAVALSFPDGMRKERELFEQCLASAESKAQRHVFFAQREVAKIPDVPKDTPIRPINTVAVIGAGTMGGGIAVSFANAGLPVKILEVTQDALDRGLGIVEKNYTASMRKGHISAAQLRERMGLLQGTLDYADLGDADLIIEAVFESMALKKEVFQKLDGVAKQGAILATNTSSLDVDVIAAATARPQDVIGLHFFSPANVMRLLEIVRGDKTAKDVIATSMRMAKQIGKVGVLSGVCFGFIGNRMLEPYIREVNMLLLEGALPRQIDRTIYDFGFAMGPCAVGDLAGIDVGYKVRQERTDLPDDARYYRISDALAEMGRYGQKTGKGFYRYEQGSRTPNPDPEVEALIESESARLGIERRHIGEQEILERCLYALINEGARILEEGIALRSLDIDVVYITGYGFPVYKGGPMYYGDSVGLRTVHQAILGYAERLGHEHGYWEPSPLLARLAAEDKAFGDL